MKHTLRIELCAALWVALGVVYFSSAPAMAQGRDMGCSSTVANPCSGGSGSGGGSSSGGGGGGVGALLRGLFGGGENAAPSRDYEAERRAQEAAEAAAAVATAERERQAEADRIERERLLKAEQVRQAREALAKRARKAFEDLEAEEQYERERPERERLKAEQARQARKAQSEAGRIRNATIPRGEGADAGAQLKSVEQSGNQARSQRNDSDREIARKGFDIGGDNAGTLVYPDKVGQKPALNSALAKLIPPGAENDPLIQKSLEWYQHLDGMKAEITQKIATVKEQQKNGTGDATVLAAQLGTLKNQDELIAKDQAKVTEAVKEQVKKNEYKINLTEGTKPSAGVKPLATGGKKE